MKRSIITVVGKDRVGIIADVCSLLAKNDINILDISQTITGGYFNMMMIVDTSASMKPYGVLADDITLFGQTIGMQIKMQQEDIFEEMHRL